MRNTILLIAVFFGLVSTAAVAEEAAGSPMDALSFMHGTWVGTATGVDQNGPFAVTQTERVGPMLDGDVIVVEGRGYEADGSLGFNAFAVISYNRQSEKYEIRAYTGGRSGTYDLELIENGYRWTIPLGPDAKVVYSATYNDDIWTEIGEYIRDGQEPRQTIKMVLTRTGDTAWPAAGAVTPPEME